MKELQKEIKIQKKNKAFLILSVIAFIILLGITIEKIAYKPLRKAPSLAVLITAIGVSYFLQNLALLIFGADTKSFTSVVNMEPLSFADGSVNTCAVP